MTSKNIVIGIDLGTTYSCVGVWINNKVEIIANDQGQRITPSWVSYDQNERLIGDAAKNQKSNYKNTIYDTKRLIGRKYNDSIVQLEKNRLPFKIINDHGKLKIVVQYKGEEKKLSPEEISACILTKMKEIAESYVGKKISKAVITVPAYFNDEQRNATKDAGIIAGLDVLRIINEPTSAAMCYGLDKKKDKLNVLIFDNGGGTHDVSLLEIEDGIFEVKATSGNPHLGGEDYDERILKYILQDINKKTKQDYSDNIKIKSKLKSECEQAKRILSTQMETSITIDSIDYSTKLTRAKFEELCIDLFRKCLEPVNQVLCDSKIAKSDIDEIVLVGGSTRIPKIRNMLKDMFNGKDLCCNINPDEAVAYGAAIQGQILSGNTNDKLKDVLLLDVNPLSLGVATGHHQAMEVLIPKNTTIPTKKTQTFTTAVDNQPGIEVKVYEGERPFVKDNKLLDTFKLEDITKAPRGTLQIEISFNIDADGILEVYAIEKQSNKSGKITIKNNNRLSQQEIDDMIAESEKYKDDDKIMKEQIEAKTQLESMLYAHKLNYKDDEYFNNLENELYSKDIKTVDYYKQKLTELVDYIKQHPQTPCNTPCQSEDNPKIDDVD